MLAHVLATLMSWMFCFYKNHFAFFSKWNEKFSILDSDLEPKNHFVEITINYFEENQLKNIIAAEILCSSDGRLIRTSACEAVHLGLIPSRVKPMTFNLVSTASLLDAQHYRDSVENKPASLLVEPLGKALGGIPPSWCGRQMTGNS